jgi:hypothetical protein
MGQIGRNGAVDDVVLASQLHHLQPAGKLEAAALCLKHEQYDMAEVLVLSVVEFLVVRRRANPGVGVRVPVPHAVRHRLDGF